MIQKFYAIRNEKAVRTGTVISTVFAVIVSGGCYFLGGFSRLFDDPAIYGADGAVVYDSIIPFMLSKLPDILIGIVVVLVLSASMSTLSSLVLTSSSTLTLDLIKGNLWKNMREESQIRTMRVLIAVFVAVSVLLAINPPDFIAQLMGISWGALAGAFLAPFLYGIYWKRVTRAAVWASFACGGRTDGREPLLPFHRLGHQRRRGGDGAGAGCRAGGEPHHPPAAGQAASGNLLLL